MSENLFSAGISILSIFITAFVGVSVRRLQAREDEKKKEKEEERIRGLAMEQGMRAMLRDRILQACEYHNSLGFAEAKARTNMQMLYDAYHQLGGNGVVTDAYNAFRNLPLYNKEKD